MNPEIHNPTESRSTPSPVLVIRQTIEALNSLDSETADHLNALAFVLMRIARADGSVCPEERRRMEDILVEHVRIPAAHAAIVTEIACHRTELADCGCSYSISRSLRNGLARPHRRSIVSLLSAVAEADGSFCALERHEIEQVAGELGIHSSEVFTRA